MTGSQRHTDRAEAFEVGAVAYLQKPIDVAHLIGLAREILRSRAAARMTDADNDNGPPSVH